MLYALAQHAANPDITIDPKAAITNVRLLLLLAATCVMVLVGIKTLLKNHQSGDTSKTMSTAVVVFICTGIIAAASVPLITGLGGGALSAVVKLLGGNA